MDEPVVAGGKVDLAALRAKVERPKLAFLELLAEHAASRIAVSMNSKAGNYAPKAFVDWEGAKGKSRTVRIAVHKQAMLDLIKGSRVESVPDGPPSKGKTKLVAASEKDNTART